MATYDVEKQSLQAEQHLHVLANDSISTYSWRHCTVEVTDRATGQPRKLLDDVSGHIEAG